MFNLPAHFYKTSKEETKMKVNQFKGIKGAWIITLLLVTGLLFAGNPCFAGESKALGKEISEKAKKMKLDKTKVVNGKKNGKKLKFTWAKLEHLKSIKDIEKGEVIGILENEAEGDETHLPPGKHNLYLKKVNGEWKLYAESGGNITAEALRVRVEESKKEKNIGKSRFESDGWCGILCGWFWGMFIYIEGCW